MALRIKDGRVISIIPPKTLSKKQLENSPRNEKLIKEATSIKLLEIINYNSSTSSYNLQTSIFKKLQFSGDIQQLNREKLFIKNICTRISKSKSVLYVLEFEEKIIGLITLSASIQLSQLSKWLVN